MNRVSSKEDLYDEMMHEPINTLIPRLAVPTIISMMVTTFYNTADTFFVSQLGTSASGACGVAFSLMSLLQAFAYMIGMGSGNLVARHMGNRNFDDAGIFVSVAFFTEILLGAFIGISGLIFLDRLVFWLGATETIAPYTRDYIKYILLAAPFMMASFGMNNMLRYEGNSFYGMLGIATGGVLNIVLDPVFIFVFGLGISGAAIATAVSQLISFTILLLQCNLMPSCIRVRLSDFRPSLKIYYDIVHTGLPSLARQGITSVSVIVLNFACQPYGDAAIAAMAIVTRIINFVNSAVIGFGQGFQPVCSYNYGAGNYKRVIEAFYFSLKVVAAFVAAIAVVVFIFAEPAVTVFRRNDPQVIAIGTLALRLRVLALPLGSVITMANMLTQSTGYGFRATFVAMLRQGICLIPILLVLPRFIGILGIQAAYPLSEILSALIAWQISKNLIKKLKSPDVPDVKVMTG